MDSKHVTYSETYQTIKISIKEKVDSVHTNQQLFKKKLGSSLVIVIALKQWIIPKAKARNGLRNIAP